MCSWFKKITDDRLHFPLLQCVMTFTSYSLPWTDGVMGVRLPMQRLQGQSLPATHCHVTILDTFFTHMPLSLNSIKWY